MSTTPASILRWSFPFKTASQNELLDPRRLQAALRQARGGSYPIGRNGIWHGGIHFDEGTQTAFDQSSVRCLADGEVIAYRIDRTYPVTHYGSGATQQEAFFSTGFVLVRHHLRMPAISGAESPTLTLFSLYMHLQDWATYEAAPTQERPTFWTNGEPLYRVKADVKDPLAGLSVHQTPHGRILGVLPRGSEVTLGAGQHDWHPLQASDDLPSEWADGWVKRGCLIPLGSSRYRIGNLAADTLQPRRNGLNLRSRDGQILSLLSPGATLKICPDASHSRYHQVTAILSGETVPPRAAEAAPRCYIWRDSLEPITQPQAFDDVVVLDTPCPIKAGDLIGHLGLYQNNGENRPQPLLHLEVFSCEDVPAFIDSCRGLADRLHAEARTLLEVPEATPLFKRLDARTGRPEVVDDSQIVQHDTLLPVALLQALPTDKHQITRLHDQDTHWWWLDDLPGPNDTLISGWFREGPGDHFRYTPWHWRGFQTLTETRGYAAQLEEEEGPLSEYLYGLIDTDQNAQLSADEIRTALAKPWLFDKLSRLITRYESEWYADEGMNKWNALDGLTGEGGLENWHAEKERIQQLGWWKSVEALDSNGLAWHLHPIAIINSLKRHANHPQIKINGIKTELTFLHFNSGEKIDDTDYSIAATQIGCEINAIKAVALVETGSSGSYFENADGDSVPSILFERHYFHRITSGRHDSDPSISNPTPGGYGQYKDQYQKLYNAYKISSSAALRSASWGRFQIMGENFSNAGYNSVEEMVKDLSLSEKNHLKAFVNLVRSNSKLSNAIICKDWESFALAYNGPKQKNYDKKMRETYEKLSEQR